MTRAMRSEGIFILDSLPFKKIISLVYKREPVSKTQIKIWNLIYLNTRSYNKLLLK
jgi:hypothetical protein